MAVTFILCKSTQILGFSTEDLNLINLISSTWPSSADTRHQTIGGKRAVIKTNTTALPNWGGGGGGAPLASLLAGRSGPRWCLWLLLSVEMIICRGRACQRGRDFRGSTDPRSFHSHNKSGCDWILSLIMAIKPFWATEPLCVFELLLLFFMSNHTHYTSVQTILQSIL